VNLPDIDTSIRVTCETGHLADFYNNAKASLTSAEEVSLSEDQTVLIVKITGGGNSPLEQHLDRGIELVQTLRALRNFPSESTVALWTVISSSQEFIGIVVPENTVQMASRAGVNFVFSVYACQEDQSPSESP